MSSNADSTRRTKDLRDAFNNLAGRHKIQLQRRLGATAVAEAEKGVRQGRDPYGKAWRPLTSRTGRPLRRTGNNIQRSWNAQVESSHVFRFGSRFKWLKTHQYGAVIKPKRFPFLRFTIETGWKLNKKGRPVRGAKGAITGTVFARSVTIPQRQLVPEPDTGGLGPIWLKAFERTTTRYLRDLTAHTGATIRGYNG